jgi:hypothetical protein
MIKVKDSLGIVDGKNSLNYLEVVRNFHYFSDTINGFLKNIILKYNKYPGYNIFNSSCSHSFWALTQHQEQDLSFQKQVLSLMKVACDSNLASIVDYAYLLDRTLINSNEKQIYGTQCFFNEKKILYELAPTEDIENLDQKRIKIGLMPIKSYLDLMNRRYKEKSEN